MGVVSGIKNVMTAAASKAGSTAGKAKALAAVGVLGMTSACTVEVGTAPAPRSSTYQVECYDYNYGEYFVEDCVRACGRYFDSYVDYAGYGVTDVVLESCGGREVYRAPAEECTAFRARPGDYCY